MTNGNAIRPEIQFVEAVRDALRIRRTVAVGKNLRFVLPTREIASDQRAVKLSGFTGGFSETDHDGPLRLWRGRDATLGGKKGTVEPAGGEDHHENQKKRPRSGEERAYAAYHEQVDWLIQESVASRSERNGRIYDALRAVVLTSPQDEVCLSAAPHSHQRHEQASWPQARS